MELLKIRNAKVVSPDKRAKVSGGLYIHFVSAENLTNGQNVKVLFEDKPHYFEVSDISITGNDLNVEAKEVGYWANFFDKNKDFDLRKIIGLDVEIVADKETLAKIQEMSCWC